MKKIVSALFLICLLNSVLLANELKSVSFDSYLNGFDYAARKEMKIKSEQMLKLLAQDKIQLVDIRFKEEYEAWHLGNSINIPLNELPKRLDELKKDRLIVTACPHNDRANIARMYLELKGYRVKYLSDGLLHTMEYLRGDKAKNYIDNLHKER